MSHDATNWAIKQRGIKPALKVVLWNLCDRYHPDNGCFPSQDTLAADCEVPRSTLNVYLRELEDAGLIAREQRRKEGSNRQERTRYRFPFEPDFPAPCVQNPCPESGHGAESRNAGEPSPENGKSRVQNLDSNPVREPVREPVNEEEARTSSDEDDERKLLHRVKIMEFGKNGKPWPGAAARSTTGALREFTALSPEDRKLAEERRDAYLAYCERQKLTPLWLSSYLKERKFLDIEAVAPRAVAALAAPETVEMAPFGPIWAGKRYWALLGGPEAVDIPTDLRRAVAAIYETMRGSSERAAAGYLARKGITLAPDGALIFPEDFEATEQRRRTMEGGYPVVNQLHELARTRSRERVDGRFAALAEMCEPVKVSDALFAQWLAHDESMGWPGVPEPGTMPVVYFPRGGPEGLSAFESAARHVMTVKGARGDEHAA